MGKKTRAVRERRNFGRNRHLFKDVNSLKLIAERPFLHSTLRFTVALSLFVWVDSSEGLQAEAQSLDIQRAW